MNFALKLWVSFKEKFVNPVRFRENNLCNLFSIGALVQENIERKVGNEGSRESHTLNRDVLEGGICKILEDYSKIELHCATDTPPPPQPYHLNQFRLFSLVSLESLANVSNKQVKLGS
jgi:hypothetical protein